MNKLKSFKFVFVIVFVLMFLYGGFVVSYSTDGDIYLETESSYVCLTGVASRVIYFESNGGTEIEKVGISSMILSDSTIPTPVREGYIFLGWYYDADLSKKVETNDLYEVNYTPRKDEKGCTTPDKVTLYASWGKKIESEFHYSVACPTGTASRIISFESNGGGTFESIIISSYPLKNYDLPTPTKEGYNFVGWYYDTKLKNKVATSDAREVKYESLKDENGCEKADRVTLYAKWKKIVVEEPDTTFVCPDLEVSRVIYFDTNGGESVEAISISADEKEEYKIPVPVKEGYNFIGWYYDIELFKEVSETDASKIRYTNEKDENGCLLVDEITLYAKWFTKDASKNEYLIRYHNDSVENKFYNIDKNSKTLLEKPVKEGYIFDGWYYDKEYTKKVDVEYVEELDGFVLAENTVLELYAKWIVQEDVNEKNTKNDVVLVGLVIIFVLLLILVICIISNKKKNKKNDIEYLGL